MARVKQLPLMMMAKIMKAMMVDYYYDADCDAVVVDWNGPGIQHYYYDTQAYYDPRH